MPVAGQKLPIIAFLLHAVLGFCSTAFSADFNSEFDEEPPARQSRPSPGNRLSLRPLQEIDDVFLDGSESRETARSSRSTGRSSFRQVNHDSFPTPLESDLPSMPGSSNNEPIPLDGQPYPLDEPSFPIDEESCDSCDALFGNVLKQNCCYDVENWSPIARWFGLGRDHANPGCSDLGIGHERVVFAPFEIDATQPTNFTMVRYDSGFGLHTPDRAEYFWSKPGKGPAVSPNSINVQDLRFINEAGTDAFSVQTEIPVRFLDPDSGGSTSGMGDMKVATKARLINGKKWQITQIFRTYINTGSAIKGVGTGHLSLEPGILARYELRPDTYVHGQVKFWIPIAGDTGFASNVLTYGVGISHVLYETNNFAIIPDFELVNYDFLSGQKTLNGINVGSGGETAINVIHGARFVIGPKGDLGLFEFGISNSIGLGDRYVNDMLRFDFKFNY
jgi:hypothetical protein